MSKSLLDKYFDSCLEDAYLMQTTMQTIQQEHPQAIHYAHNAQDDALRFALSQDGALCYLVKAPVITMAVLAYCRAYLQTNGKVALERLTCQALCDLFGVATTHRHQVDWPLQLLKKHL